MSGLSAYPWIILDKLQSGIELPFKIHCRRWFIQSYITQNAMKPAYITLFSNQSHLINPSSFEKNSSI